MREPIVRLVYERTAAPGVDGGVEPLIAVCATEDEAAERRTADELRQTGDTICHTRTLPIGWRATFGP